jgi:hypothetical protein
VQTIHKVEFAQLSPKELEDLTAAENRLRQSWQGKDANKEIYLLAVTQTIEE